MVQIFYFPTVLGISLLWLFLRCIVWRKQRRISLRREGQLLLVYICLVVAARFTFFPFGTINGQIQPLVFDPARIFPFRVNWMPLVNLMDYKVRREALVNLIGNVAMFVPMGIVWPGVFRELDTPGKAIAAGFGLSLCIELLQLPFFDRCSDIDDLILNTGGYLIGYGCFLLVRSLGRARKRKPSKH